MLPTPLSGRPLLLSLAAALLAAIATVPPALADPLDLTLDDALLLAHERSAALSLADAELSALLGEAAEAALPARDSQLALSGGPRFADSDGLDVELEWSRRFEARGARAARGAVAQAELKVSESRKRLLELELLSQVAELHALGLHADARMQAAIAEFALAGRLVEAASIRRELGESGRLDEVLAMAASGRSSAAMARAEAHRERTTGRLRALLGLAPSTPIRLLGDLAALAAESSEIDAPPAFHPIVAGLQAREDRASAEVDLARTSGRSVRGFKAGVGREENATLVFAGISWTLPVRERGRGLVEAAVSRREGLALARDLEARRTAALAAGEAQAAHRLAEGIEDLLELGLAPLEEATRLVGEAYELGALPLTEVLSASRELSAARIEQLDLMRDAAIAALRARSLAGQEPRS